MIFKNFIFLGSTELMLKSKTKMENKLFIEVENGLHDLLGNKMKFVSEKVIDWITNMKNE